MANYLDEKCPESSLYNDETKSRDLELLDYFSKVLTTTLRSNLSFYLETINFNNRAVYFVDYGHFCKLHI